MRRVNEIIVHCTATPEGRHTTVDEIRAWHKQRGWSDIGYHYVVYLDGSVHTGRPVEQVGAHVAGHNTGTIGVVYVGGVEADGRTPKDTRTPAQKTALVKLLKDLLGRFPTIGKISGHHDYAPKACPCFPARREYADLVDGYTPSTALTPDKRYRWLQRLLIAAGFDPGLADGLPGPRTEAAIGHFQRSRGLPVSNAFDAATVAALRKVTGA